jgi:hypothetical protein
MRKSIDGYILLESLVALAVLGFMVVMFTVSISQQQRLIQDTKSFIIAHAKANEVMEILKGVPFDTLESYSLPSVEGLPDSYGEVEVSDFSTSALKRILVIISWRRSGGHIQSISLSTLRAKR